MNVDNVIMCWNYLFAPHNVIKSIDELEISCFPSNGQLIIYQNSKKSPPEKDMFDTNGKLACAVFSKGGAALRLVVSGHKLTATGRKSVSRTRNQYKEAEEMTPHEMFFDVPYQYLLGPIDGPTGTTPNNEIPQFYVAKYDIKGKLADDYALGRINYHDAMVRLLGLKLGNICCVENFYKNYSKKFAVVVV